MSIPNNVIKTFKPNQCFSSYTHLCSVLNIPATGGNIKKANLQALSLLCDYTISGHKIIINKVFAYPAPKPSREGNRWVDDAICEVVLEELQKLLQADKEVTNIFITSHSLATLIGLCNKNFYYNRDKYVYCEPNLKEQASTDFYKIASAKIPSVVNSVLNSLKSRYYIHWIDTYSITRNQNKRLRVLELATNEEIALIKDAQEQVSMTYPFNRLKNYASIMQSPLKDKFNREVNLILTSMEFGFVIKSKGVSFFVTDSIKLRLSCLKRAAGVKKISSEMREYLKDKMDTKLNTQVFLGYVNSREGVVSRESQKEAYEVIFKAHIDEEI